MTCQSTGWRIKSWMEWATTPYIYVIVRKDLTDSQQIVQACHATHVSGAEFGTHKNCHLVLCTLENEEDLKGWSLHLKNEGINHSLFFEPDPEEAPVGYTALCTEMVYNYQRELFRTLPLREDPICLCSTLNPEK